MTTKAGVINEALMLLEQPETANIESSTDTWVRKVLNRYPDTVRRLLSDHPWNFASDRTGMTQVAETPIGWDYAYNKPGDCLRNRFVNSSGEADDTENDQWEDEGGRILTDMDPCYLFYVSSRFLTLEGAWPQKFAYAVSAELNFVCRPVHSGNLEKQDWAEKHATKSLQKAKSWDAAQKPFRRNPAGTWVRVRHGGSRFTRLTQG